MKEEPTYNDYSEDFDLSEMAPFLHKLEKKEMFKAPEGYFDQLPGIIHQQVRSAPEPPMKTVVTFWQRLFSREMLAGLSLCALLALAVFWVTQARPQTFSNDRFAALSNEELLAAIDVQELSDQELVNLMESQHLSGFSLDGIEMGEWIEGTNPEENGADEEESLDFGDIETNDLMDFYY